MSKPKGGMNSVTKVVILILLALTALVFYDIFLFAFAPIIVYYVWEDHNKIKRLEAKLAESETPTDGTRPEQA